MEWLIGIGILLLIFIGIILVRTFLFQPKNEETDFSEDVEFDKERVVANLQALIQCRTVSYKNKQLEDEAEFLRLEATLKNIFPLVHEKMQWMKLGNRSLLYFWPGVESTLEPTVLMAHYDVVPVHEASWQEAPFAGVIKDGYLWGRGTLDTKITLNGTLSAAEYLLEKGYTPQKDMYFAFAGDEEIAGKGAVVIVDWFEEKKMKPSLVVDEGGAVVSKIFPGVEEDCALVGIAEKGMLELELVLESSGGHASSPKPHTVVGELAQACVNVEKNPFPKNVSLPAKKMFDVLGRRSNFMYRMIFANQWLFGGLLDAICKKNGGELNALMRTTMAFTQMQGSDANNVIPPYATMGINSRIMNGETSDEVVSYLKKVIANDKIQIVKKNVFEPSRISEVDCPGYEIVKKAIQDTWKGVLVSPYLMIACSDSRHYGRISPYVYRFSAMKLSLEERKSIHGNNEKVPLDTIHQAVAFYIRLIQMC